MQSTRQICIWLFLPIAFFPSIAASESLSAVDWAKKLDTCGVRSVTTGTLRRLIKDEYIRGIQLTKATKLTYSSNHLLFISSIYDGEAGLTAFSDFYNEDSIGVNLTIARSTTPPTPIANGALGNVATRSGFAIGTKVKSLITKLGSSEQTVSECAGKKYIEVTYINPGCQDTTTFTAIDGTVARIDYTGPQC